MMIRQRSDNPKTVDFEAVLKALGANLESSTRNSSPVCFITIMTSHYQNIAKLLTHPSK